MGGRRAGKFLSAKEKEFANEYLINGSNAQEAARKIYKYSTTSACSTKGNKLLNVPTVRNYIIMRTEEIAQEAISKGITPGFLLDAHKVAVVQAVINIQDGKDLKPQSDVIKDMTASVNSMTGWTAAKQIDVTAQDKTSDSIATQAIAEFKDTYLTINNEES